MSNRIQFAQGERFETTDQECPMCKQAKLLKDKMNGPVVGFENQEYICPKCGYKEYRTID